jgi:hypothetical protein
MAAIRAAGVVIRVEHQDTSGPSGFAVAFGRESELKFELVRIEEENKTSDNG